MQDIIWCHIQTPPITPELSGFSVISFGCCSYLRHTNQSSPFDVSYFFVYISPFNHIPQVIK